jgi:predicted DNA-binding transcriptional regulator AlpA
MIGDLMAEIKRLQADKEHLLAELRQRDGEIEQLKAEGIVWMEIFRRLQMIGISRTTLWRMVHNGMFPFPLKIGSMSRRWSSLEVEAWMRALQPANAQVIPNAELAETESNTINQKKHLKRKPRRGLETT